MQAVCDILEQLVTEEVITTYAIGGATAAGFHGEPLATRDIDVFIYLSPVPGSSFVTLEPLFQRLAELGFAEFEEEALLIHGFPVQFLCANPGLESEALENALLVEWDHSRMRVIRPEYLAAIALSVGRPKDRARLVFLAELPNFDRSKLAAILESHALSDRWGQWAAALGLAP